MKEELVEMFKKTGAFKTGDFVLASGRKSNVYVDCRLLTLDGEALSKISQYMLNCVQKNTIELPTYFGGVTSGADPIVAGVITTAWDYGIVTKGFFVRKEAKGHGLKKQIEGHCPPGERVVIFDDVATTGGSSQIAVDAVQEIGSVP